MAPAFDGDLEERKRFLSLAGIQLQSLWTVEDTEAAHSAWQRHIKGRREGSLPKRPLADILIGAFASNRRGLITRNARDFRSRFPNLEILKP